MGLKFDQIPMIIEEFLKMFTRYSIGRNESVRKYRDVPSFNFGGHAYWIKQLPTRLSMDKDKNPPPSVDADEAALPELFFTYDECIEVFWINPWSKEKEKLFMMMWPGHPIEETEKVEKWFESYAKRFVQAGQASERVKRDERLDRFIKAAHRVACEYREHVYLERTKFHKNFCLQDPHTELCESMKNSPCLKEFDEALAALESEG